MASPCAKLHTAAPEGASISSRARPAASVLRRRPEKFDSCRRSVVVRGVVPVGERNGWWEKDPQPNLISADGIDEIISTLEKHSDRLVLLDFYAGWCASCKALYPKLAKLCQQNPHILVVKVNFDDNKELAKTLGVKVLPFFHAYHGSMGRVAAFSSSISKIQRLKDCIEIFGQPYCNIGTFDWHDSLPEFDNLPVPDDATRLEPTTSTAESAGAPASPASARTKALI